MVVRGRQSLRSLWLAMHLYLGLWLGGIIALAGITGSVLVFYVELDALLNPELAITEPDAPRQSYEAIYQALRQAEPQRSSAWRLEIPRQAESTISARYYNPQETEHKGFAPLIVSVNPYTVQVMKQRFWGEYAMTWLYDLHYTLLLGPLGKIVMAMIGAILLLSLISGVYLWWPPRHKWRAALTYKRGASRQRVVYDLHKLAGIYGFIVLLGLTLTGIALEIPDYVNPLIDRVSPLQKTAKPKSQVPQLTPLPHRLTLDQALEIAQRVFPNADLCWIETPDSSEGSYRFNFRQQGEPSRRFPKTNVWIDQYSGAILQVHDPRTFSAGDSLLTWFHPLHSGEALAMPGRVLVLLTGMLCPLLFITGVVRWTQKRKAQRLRQSMR